MAQPPPPQLCDVARKTHISFAEPVDASPKAVSSDVGSQSHRQLFEVRPPGQILFACVPPLGLSPLFPRGAGPHGRPPNGCSHARSTGSSLNPRFLPQAAMDSAHDGALNRAWAASSSMTSILDDRAMRPVRKDSWVSPQHNEGAYAAARGAVATRAMFQKQKEIVSSSAGVRTTLCSEGALVPREMKVISAQQAKDSLMEKARPPPATHTLQAARPVPGPALALGARP